MTRQEFQQAFIRVLQQPGYEGIQDLVSIQHSEVEHALSCDEVINIITHLAAQLEKIAKDSVQSKAKASVAKLVGDLTAATSELLAELESSDLLYESLHTLYYSLCHVDTTDQTANSSFLSLLPFARKSPSPPLTSSPTGSPKAGAKTAPSTPIGTPSFLKLEDPLVAENSEEGIESNPARFTELDYLQLIERPKPLDALLYKRVADTSKLSRVRDNLRYMITNQFIERILWNYYQDSVKKFANLANTQQQVLIEHRRYVCQKIYQALGFSAEKYSEQRLSYQATTPLLEQVTLKGKKPSEQERQLVKAETRLSADMQATLTAIHAEINKPSNTPYSALGADDFEYTIDKASKREAKLKADNRPLDLHVTSQKYRSDFIEAMLHNLERYYDSNYQGFSLQNLYDLVYEAAHNPLIRSYFLQSYQSFQLEVVADFQTIPKDEVSERRFYIDLKDCSFYQVDESKKITRLCDPWIGQIHVSGALSLNTEDAPATLVQIRENLKSNESVRELKDSSEISEFLRKISKEYYSNIPLIYSQKTPSGILRGKDTRVIIETADVLRIENISKDPTSLRKNSFGFHIYTIALHGACECKAKLPEFIKKAKPAVDLSYDATLGSIVPSAWLNSIYYNEAKPKEEIREILASFATLLASLGETKKSLKSGFQVKLANDIANFYHVWRDLSKNLKSYIKDAQYRALVAAMTHEWQETAALLVEKVNESYSQKEEKWQTDRQKPGGARAARARFVEECSGELYVNPLSGYIEATATARVQEQYRQQLITTTDLLSAQLRPQLSHDTGYIQFDCISDEHIHDVYGMLNVPFLAGDKKQLEKSFAERYLQKLNEDLSDSRRLTTAVETAGDLSAILGTYFSKAIYDSLDKKSKEQYQQGLKKLIPFCIHHILYSCFNELYVSKAGPEKAKKLIEGFEENKEILFGTAERFGIDPKALGPKIDLGIAEYLLAHVQLEHNDPSLNYLLSAFTPVTFKSKELFYEAICSRLLASVTNLYNEAVENFKNNSDWFVTDAKLNLQGVFNPLLAETLDKHGSVGLKNEYRALRQSIAPYLAQAYFFSDESQCQNLSQDELRELVEYAYPSDTGANAWARLFQDAVLQRITDYQFTTTEQVHQDLDYAINRVKAALIDAKEDGRLISELDVIKGFILSANGDIKPSVALARYFKPEFTEKLNDAIQNRAKIDTVCNRLSKFNHACQLTYTVNPQLCLGQDTLDTLRLADEKGNSDAVKAFIRNRVIEDWLKFFAERQQYKSAYEALADISTGTDGWQSVFFNQEITDYIKLYGTEEQQKRYALYVGNVHAIHKEWLAEQKSPFEANEMPEAVEGTGNLMVTEAALENEDVAAELPLDLPKLSDQLSSLSEELRQYKEGLDNKFVHFHRNTRVDAVKKLEAKISVVTTRLTAFEREKTLANLQAIHAALTELFSAVAFESKSIEWEWRLSSTPSAFAQLLAGFSRQSKLKVSHWYLGQLQSLSKEVYGQVLNRDALASVLNKYAFIDTTTPNVSVAKSTPLLGADAQALQGIKVEIANGYDAQPIPAVSEPGTAKTCQMDLTRELNQLKEALKGYQQASKKLTRPSVKAKREKDTKRLLDQVEAILYQLNWSVTSLDQLKEVEGKLSELLIDCQNCYHEINKEKSRLSQALEPFIVIKAKTNSVAPEPAIKQQVALWSKKQRYACSQLAIAADFENYCQTASFQELLVAAKAGELQQMYDRIIRAAAEGQEEGNDTSAMFLTNGIAYLVGREWIAYHLLAHDFDLPEVFQANVDCYLAGLELALAHVLNHELSDRTNMSAAMPETLQKVLANAQKAMASIKGSFKETDLNGKAVYAAISDQCHTIGSWLVEASIRNKRHVKDLDVTEGLRVDFTPAMCLVGFQAACKLPQSDESKEVSRKRISDEVQYLQAMPVSFTDDAYRQGEAESVFYDGYDVQHLRVYLCHYVRTVVVQNAHGVTFNFNKLFINLYLGLVFKGSKNSTPLVPANELLFILDSVEQQDLAEMAPVLIKHIFDQLAEVEQADGDDVPAFLAKFKEIFQQKLARMAKVAYPNVGGDTIAKECVVKHVFDTLNNLFISPNGFDVFSEDSAWLQWLVKNVCSEKDKAEFSARVNLLIQREKHHYHQRQMGLRKENKTQDAKFIGVYNRFNDTELVPEFKDSLLAERFVGELLDIVYDLHAGEIITQELCLMILQAIQAFNNNIQKKADNPCYELEGLVPFFKHGDLQKDIKVDKFIALVECIKLASRHLMSVRLSSPTTVTVSPSEGEFCTEADTPRDSTASRSSDYTGYHNQKVFIIHGLQAAIDGKLDQILRLEILKESIALLQGLLNIAENSVLQDTRFCTHVLSFFAKPNLQCASLLSLERGFVTELIQVVSAMLPKQIDHGGLYLSESDSEGDDRLGEQKQVSKAATEAIESLAQDCTNIQKSLKIKQEVKVLLLGMLMANQAKPPVEIAAMPIKAHELGDYAKTVKGSKYVISSPYAVDYFADGRYVRYPFSQYPALQQITNKILKANGGALTLTPQAQAEVLAAFKLPELSSEARKIMEPLVGSEPEWSELSDQVSQQASWLGKLKSFDEGAVLILSDHEKHIFQTCLQEMEKVDFQNESLKAIHVKVKAAVETDEPKLGLGGEINAAIMDYNFQRLKAKLESVRDELYDYFYPNLVVSLKKALGLSKKDPAQGAAAKNSAYNSLNKDPKLQNKWLATYELALLIDSLLVQPEAATVEEWLKQCGDIVVKFDESMRGHKRSKTFKGLLVTAVAEIDNSLHGYTNSASPRRQVSKGNTAPAASLARTVSSQSIDPVTSDKREANTRRSLGWFRQGAK